MYKVFINDKPLFFTSRKESLQHAKNNFLILEYNSDKEIDKIINLLGTPNKLAGALLYSRNVKALWKKFCLKYKIIEAAGGIVFNKKKELLMIYRLERWDLPKGKIEKNESSKKAALREVCEETGVCDCKIIKKSAVTYHTYSFKGNKILKKTFWFEMNCKSFNGFKVQKEENITKAAWIKKTQLKNKFRKTYPSIVDLVECVI